MSRFAVACASGDPRKTGAKWPPPMWPEHLAVSGKGRAHRARRDQTFNEFAPPVSRERPSPQLLQDPQRRFAFVAHGINREHDRLFEHVLPGMDGMRYGIGKTEPD